MTGDLAMRLRTPKDYTGRGEKEVEDSILKGTGVPKIVSGVKAEQVYQYYYWTLHLAAPPPTGVVIIIQNNYLAS